MGEWLGGMIRVNAARGVVFGVGEDRRSRMLR